MRNVESSLPIEDDTIYRIYSMTKPLISILAMMLHEEGYFDLNDDVGQWIPTLKEPRVWVGGTPQNYQTVPSREPVRVWHLLSHMSGLTYFFNYNHPIDAIYRQKGYDFGNDPGTDLAGAVDDWCSVPLLFEPGTQWNYSVSTDVVGRLIEIWTGQTLGDVLRERLTGPLGMVDTDFHAPAASHDRLAELYIAVAGAAIPGGGMSNGAKHPPRNQSGGGGLVSTAADYNRFMTMLVNGGIYNGTRLLSSRTLDLMTRNHLPDNADLEKLAGDSFSEVSYAGIGFGLGFSVVLDAARNKVPTSEGSFAWGGAASTAFWVDPVEELTVGFYTQVLPSGTYPLRRELQRLVYAALVD
jgi:CubicO group peptidase (beta-lactamase class C family)